MIKLIATDCDGTIVKDGTLQINPEYYDVVHRLVQKGIYFVVCSGRQYTSEAKLFAPIKNELFYISDGGTVVRTPDKILKMYPLEEEIWKGMYETVQTMPQCDCFVAMPDYCLAEDAGSTMFHWLKDSYGFDIRESQNLSKISNKDVIKFSVYHKNACEEMCAPVFTPTWENKAKLVCAGKEWVDCSARDAGKGTAIAWLQNYLGIKPEETMAFGDNINDIEMLQNAGESYAVSNAREEVRAAAHKTCAPYWEYGVLEVLKSLL